MSDKFKMAPTPELMSDTGIHRLWPDGPELPTEISDEDLARAKAATSLVRWSAALNPETMSHKSYVLDLQRKYAFEITRHSLDRRPEFHCIDMLTFDPDPGSKWHLIGYGETEGDAKLDLLERIAYAVAHEH